MPRKYASIIFYQRASLQACRRVIFKNSSTTWVRPTCETSESSDCNRFATCQPQRRAARPIARACRAPNCPRARITSAINTLHFITVCFANETHMTWSCTIPIAFHNCVFPNWSTHDMKLHNSKRIDCFCNSPTAEEMHFEEWICLLSFQFRNTNKRIDSYHHDVSDLAKILGSLPKWSNKKL